MPISLGAGLALGAASSLGNMIGNNISAAENRRLQEEQGALNRQNAIDIANLNNAARSALSAQEYNQNRKLRQNQYQDQINSMIAAGVNPAAVLGGISNTSQQQQASTSSTTNSRNNELVNQAIQITISQHKKDFYKNLSKLK